MKRKLLLIITVCALVLGLFSCNPSDDGNDTPNTPVGEKENLIYNSTTDISLIFMGDEVTDETASAVYNLLFPYVHTEYLHIYIDELPEKAEHEIIVGKTDREISKRAYTYLERENYNELGDFGYLIYSDGSSVAIAYTEALNYSTLNEIVLNFAKEYFSEELVLKKGIVKKEKLNLMSIFEEEDKARQDLQWANLEKKAGTEVMEAMKQLYKLYKPDVVDWFANLYEHRICICTTTDEQGNVVCQHPLDENGNPLCYNGGFYYSNSGRNTVGYLPDIESTNQALSFLESSGMLSSLGGRYATNVPDWMRNEIVAFVKGLQDETGYFYHPQWSKELHHQNPERMGRDLSWATSMLKNFGASPYYTTPGGALQGVGKPSEANLTSKLGSSSVSAVSKVVATAGLNAHLATPETFKAYLDSLHINTNSYSAGSVVGAQTTTIKEIDRKLAGITSGAGFDYRNNGVYSKILFDWLEDNQNPENGLWDADSDYQACDGLFKIVNIYNDYGLAMSYPLEAALATIDAISSDEPVYTVCNMYNAWANIGLIKNNLKNNSSDKNAANELIATINAAIIEVAPEAIRITAQKTANFAIPDGSFSYLIGHSSETSTGMPTAVLYAYEGDVNATLICYGGLIGHINNALDTPKVNTHGLADWYRFVNIVEENNPSIKGGNTSGGRFDFEIDAIDDVPADATVTISSAEGAITVKEDPFNEKNKVLNIYHPYEPGKGDSVRFNNPMSSLSRNCSVFESDFLVTSEGTDNTYVAQFSFDGAYYFTFRLADGKLGIWEDSSTELSRSKARHLTDVALDEWFSMRIEYYQGTHDTVRIKLYVNDELIAVSANYGDYAGTAVKNESGSPKKGFTFFYMNPLSYVNLNMYMDNLLITSVNQEYESEADTEGLIVNADMPEKDRVTHTFDEDALPEGFEITGGGTNVSVSDGKLNFAKDSKTSVLTVQRDMKVGMSNCYSVGFDLDFTDADNGDVFTLAYTEPYHFENKVTDITKHTVKCITEGGVKYLIVTSKGGTLSYESTKIKIDDEPVSLEFVYFTKQMQTLIYVNGDFIGLSDYYIPSNPHIYEFGYLTLTFTGKMEGSIDNLFVESANRDYEKATEPDVERELHDFSTGIPAGVTTNGSLFNGTLKLQDDGILTIPANKRVDTVNSYDLGINMTLTASDKLTRVYFTDKDGGTVFALDLLYNGMSLIIYEVTEQGRYSNAVATIASDGELDMILTYYTANRVAALKLDGNYVLATSLAYSATAGEPVSATVSSSTALIKTAYLDGMIFNYIPFKLSSENQDNVDSIITYEYSSLGNTPTRVTSTLIAAGASSGIELMMKDGEYTKVYRMTSASGGNDYVDFILQGNATNKLVFETDLYLKTSGYFEIHVLKGADSSNSGYRAILWNSGTNLKMYDTSGNSNQTPGPEKVIGKIGEWMRFKLEIDLGNGTEGSAMINTYVNGELVYSSQNFFGSYKNAVSALTQLNRVRFYTWGAGVGDFIFDNTSVNVGKCLHAGLEEGEILTAPTCTEEGDQQMICTTPDCGYTTTKPIPAKGHTMGEWIADESDPTVERSDCADCDHFETRDVVIPEEPPIVPDLPEEGEGDFIDGGGWAPVGGND